MEHNRQNLSFLTIFCPFTPLTTQKIKIFKKQKQKSEDIIILHKCTINDNHMIYVAEIRIITDRFFFGYFGPFSLHF